MRQKKMQYYQAKLSSQFSQDLKSIVSQGKAAQTSRNQTFYWNQLDQNINSIKQKSCYYNKNNFGASQKDNQTTNISKQLTRFQSCQLKSNNNLKNQKNKQLSICNYNKLSKKNIELQKQEKILRKSSKQLNEQMIYQRADSVKFLYLQQDTESQKQLPFKMIQQSAIINKQDLNSKIMIDCLSNFYCSSNQNSDIQLRLLLKQKKNIQKQKQRIQRQKRSIIKKQQQINKLIIDYHKKKNNQLRNSRKKSLIKKQLNQLNQLDDKLKQIYQVRNSQKKKKLVNRLILQKLFINISKVQNQQKYIIKKLKNQGFQKIKLTARLNKLIQILQNNFKYARIKFLKLGFIKIKTQVKNQCSNKFKKIFLKIQENCLHQNILQRQSLNSSELVFTKPFLQNNSPQIQYIFTKGYKIKPQQTKLLQYQNKRINNQNILPMNTMTLNKQRSSKNFNHLINLNNSKKSNGIESSHLKKKTPLCLNSKRRNVEVLFTSKK